MSLDLPRLWLYTLFAVSLFIWTTAFCDRENIRTSQSVPVVIPAEKDTLNPQTPPPSYTYVGQVASPENQAAQSGPVKKVKESPVARETQVDTASGLVPDLDIRLAGNPVRQVMFHYGYVPAIKSKTRLLGKIVGDQFLPVSDAELRGFATRGRSGRDFPRAEAWRKRVAKEFGLPPDELHCIFLVPQPTEQFFIDAQTQALARTDRAGNEIVLMRAHFAPDLALIIDALVTSQGETIPVDSVRTEF